MAAEKQPTYPVVPKTLLFKQNEGPDADELLWLVNGSTLQKPEHKRAGIMTHSFLTSLTDATWGVACMRLLQTEASSVTPLVGKAQKLFVCDGYDGGIVSIPSRTIVFSESVLPKDKAVDLPIAGLRVHEYDHAVLGEARGFWPPAIVEPEHDGRASWCWEAVATDAGEDKQWTLPEEAVQELVAHVGALDYVAFRQINRTNRASKAWVVRMVWGEQGNTLPGEPQDFSASGGLKFEARRRCAFCSISPPWSSYHDHAQCPYLGTLNKVRENLRIEHIRVTALGKLVLPRTKRQIDLDAHIAADAKWKAETSQKIGELFALLKSSKKRKADDSAGPSKPTKAPKKEKDDKDKGKGQGGSGSKGSKDKGKGKAK